MSQALQSDIVSLEAYIKNLVDEDPELKSFVLESGSNPFEMERFDYVSNTSDFNYPALAMLMPIITGDDNEMHNFEARQEVAFCILYSTDGSHEEKLEGYRKSQLDCWRLLKYLRRDSKSGKFRIDKMSYKMAPFAYGRDNSVGSYVVVTLITSTNYLIGS